MLEVRVVNQVKEREHISNALRLRKRSIELKPGRRRRIVSKDVPDLMANKVPVACGAVNLGVNEEPIRRGVPRKRAQEQRWDRTAQVIGNDPQANGTP